MICTLKIPLISLPNQGLISRNTKNAASMFKSLENYSFLLVWFYWTMSDGFPFTGSYLLTDSIPSYPSLPCCDCSGYDFGYLLKILTCKALPPDETEFFNQLSLYFPCIYDIKFLMKSCKNLKGGLQDVAEELQIQRIGPQHQAGSDSLLTAMTFFGMRKVYFDDKIDDGKFLGHLYGLVTPAALRQQMDLCDSSGLPGTSTSSLNQKPLMAATLSANEIATSAIQAMQ